MGIKKWWKSRTIIGALIALVAGVLGPEVIPAELQDTLVGQIDNLVALIGTVIAIFGRVKAVDKIG